MITSDCTADYTIITYLSGLLNLTAVDGRADNERTDNLQHQMRDNNELYKLLQVGLSTSLPWPWRDLTGLPIISLPAASTLYVMGFVAGHLFR